MIKNFDFLFILQLWLFFGLMLSLILRSVNLHLLLLDFVFWGKFAVIIQILFFYLFYYFVQIVAFKPIHVAV